jgi:hypothetical protein
MYVIDRRPGDKGATTYIHALQHQGLKTIVVRINVKPRVSLKIEVAPHIQETKAAFAFYRFIVLHAAPGSAPESQTYIHPASRVLQSSNASPQPTPAVRRTSIASRQKTVIRRRNG